MGGIILGLGLAGAGYIIYKKYKAKSTRVDVPGDGGTPRQTDETRNEENR